MKAMIIKSFGSSDVFEHAEVAKPVIKAGHVLVRIAASSVNTVDTMLRQMGDELPIAPPLPAILGMDFAGVVEAVGDDVTNFKVGDEVYGCAGGLADLPGTLAEYIVADADLMAIKPKNLSMQEAAAIPLVGITAWEGLLRAGVKSGQSVLVHGGAGGVGHIALQLANYLGGEVYATGSGPDKLALIEKLGARSIEYKTESVADYVDRCTNGVGFDVVFDSVGGANMANSFEAAALNGQIASTVSMVELDLSTAHFKGLSLHVVFMLIPILHKFKRAEHHAILNKLTQIAEADKLKPILDAQQFTLEQAAAAHDRLSSGKAVGKVVISH